MPGTQVVSVEPIGARRLAVRDLAPDAMYAEIRKSGLWVLE